MKHENRKFFLGVLVGSLISISFFAGSVYASWHKEPIQQVIDYLYRIEQIILRIERKL